MWDEDGDAWVVVEAEPDVDPAQYIPRLQSRRLLRRQSSLGMSRSLSVPAATSCHRCCERIGAWPRPVLCIRACMQRSSSRVGRSLSHMASTRMGRSMSSLGSSVAYHVERHQHNMRAVMCMLMGRNRSHACHAIALFSGLDAQIRTAFRRLPRQAIWLLGAACDLAQAIHFFESIGVELAHLNM